MKEAPLDKAWSKLIKLRAKGRCEYCGSTKALNSHHIFTRSKRSTRWDPENGICLCVTHHMFSSDISAHTAPRPFWRWLEKYKGEEFLDDLELKSNTTRKWSAAEKRELLQNLNKQINDLK